MKNFFLPLTLVLFFFSIRSFAQTYEQANMQLQFFNHFGKAYAKGYSGPSHLGSESLYDEWMPMDISFKDTTVRFDAVKLNLLNSTLDVLYKGEEKTIANIHFDYAATTDANQPRKFYPANKIYYNNKPLEGFVETIGDGDEKVLVQHYIYIKEPIPQANIVGGPTVHRLMKQSDNYIFDGNKLTLIRRKKDLQEYYRRKSRALEQYLKEEKPDIRNPGQLYGIVEKMSRKS